MLEIYISNVSVDLPKDIQLAITVENPLMLEDRIPAPYSLNFDLPNTPKNRKLFGYPDRIGAYGTGINNTKLNKPCTIRFQGMEVLKGHVVFLQFLTTIKLQFIGIDYNEYLKAPMNILDVGRKYFLGSYNTVDYANSNNFAYQYARWAEELANGSRGDIVASPIAIVDKNIPFNNYYEVNRGFGHNADIYGFYANKVYFKAQDEEYFNSFNPYNGSFLLEKQDNPTQSTRVFKSHASIFPQFRVGYLLDVIFGDLLLNNPFTDGYLYNLVMPSLYFSQWKIREETDVIADSSIYNNYPPMVSNPRPSPSSPYPGEPYVELNDFLPSTSSNDFVRSILNLFCMTMATSNGKLLIKSNQSILMALPTKDWSHKIASELDFKLEKSQQYIYGYESSKKENVNTSGAITVSSRYEMMNYPYTLDEQGFYEEKFIVQDQVYVKTIQNVEVKHVAGQKTETQISYAVQDSGFDFSMEKEKNETFDMTSSILPLPLYPAIFYNRIDNVYEEDNDYTDRMKYWVVPGIKDLDRNTRPSEIYLTFFRGLRLVKDETDKYYPSLGGNLESSITGPQILSWNGQYGLLETYHKRFLEWIEKDKVNLNVNLRLNPVELRQLDVLEKIHIKGRNFFIKKMQYTIGLNHISPVNIDFIEA